MGILHLPTTGTPAIAAAVTTARAGNGISGTVDYNIFYKVNP